MSSNDFVEAKLRHMIDRLRAYADHMEAGEHEQAFEAADAIGSDDGEGCEICERLSSSLSASVPYSMWFPDPESGEQIAESAAGRARGYADELESELEG
jgi:hypothetical protein